MQIEMKTLKIQAKNTGENVERDSNWDGNPIFNRRGESWTSEYEHNGL